MIQDHERRIIFRPFLSDSGGGQDGIKFAVPTTASTSGCFSEFPCDSAPPGIRHDQLCALRDFVLRHFENVFRIPAWSQ